MIDFEIIEECRKGNLDNFRILVRETAPFAFSVAFRMLGDEALAEDVVQETMVTVWQKIGKVKSSGGFKLWLYRIVINKCCDELRRKKRSSEYTPDEAEWAIISNHISHEEPAELENKETAALIRILTDRLSPKQKAAFILCDLEELTADEAAEITGTGKTNLKANLHYAREKISELIKKYV